MIRATGAKFVCRAFSIQILQEFGNWSFANKTAIETGAPFPRRVHVRLARPRAWTISPAYSERLVRTHWPADGSPSLTSFRKR